EWLKQRSGSIATFPTCVSSEPKRDSKAEGNGIGHLAEDCFLEIREILSDELVDTTGAGDTFIGTVLNALCPCMPPEKMLPFDSQVLTLLNIKHIPQNLFIF
ncbi:hypothetical protein HID58_056767, partial [Brassica napus]